MYSYFHLFINFFFLIGGQLCFHQLDHEMVSQILIILNMFMMYSLEIWPVHVLSCMYQVQCTSQMSM